MQTKATSCTLDGAIQGKVPKLYFPCRWGGTIKGTPFVPLVFSIFYVMLKGCLKVMLSALIFMVCVFGATLGQWFLIFRCKIFIIGLVSQGHQFSFYSGLTPRQKLQVPECLQSNPELCVWFLPTLDWDPIRTPVAASGPWHVQSSPWESHLSSEPRERERLTWLLSF